MAAMDQAGGPTDLRYGPPAPPSSTPDPGRSRPPARRGLPPAAWPVVVLVIAVALGAAVTYFVTATGSAGSDDAWGELGAFLLGLVLGVLAFAVSYLLGLVLAARASLPRGQRVLPVALSVAIPAVVVAAASALSALAGDAGTSFPESIGIVALLGALVAAPFAFAWSATRRGRRRLAIGTAALLVLMTAATGVQVAHARHQVAVAATRVPFVLFAGGTADAPYDGWRRDTFTSTTIRDDVGSIARGGLRAELKYLTDSGVVYVTMHSDIGACLDTDRYTCRVTGTLYGAELRHYERTTPYGSYPQADTFEVLVQPDGSAVSVSGEDPASRAPGWPAVLGARVLASLVRVDRQQFERATGTRLRLR